MIRRFLAVAAFTLLAAPFSNAATIDASVAAAMHQSLPRLDLGPETAEIVGRFPGLDAPYAAQFYGGIAALMDSPQFSSLSDPDARMAAAIKARRAQAYQAGIAVAEDNDKRVSEPERVRENVRDVRYWLLPTNAPFLAKGMEQELRAIRPEIEARWLEQRRQAVRAKVAALGVPPDDSLDYGLDPKTTPRERFAELKARFMYFKRRAPRYLDYYAKTAPVGKAAGVSSRYNEFEDLLQAIVSYPEGEHARELLRLWTEVYADFEVAIQDDALSYNEKSRLYAEGRAIKLLLTDFNTRRGDSPNDP